MKKTLIALTVTISAAVSGSAMAAFQTGGVSGSVDIGGNLNPVSTVNPWEAEIGVAASGLNAEMGVGATNATINVTNAIPVLGIRTTTNDAFQGGAGISPQVSYGNTVSFASAVNGVGVLTLDVKDKATSNKIGSMTAPFYAGAVISESLKDGSGATKLSIYASDRGNAFYGGVPAVSGMVDPDPETNVTTLSAAYTANFNLQNATVNTSSKTSLNNKGKMYSGYYGSGILPGSTISITLDSGFNGATEWAAQLPVTVSYQ
ncbi:K88 fimbrial protein AC [Escherichia coli]|uniref:F4 family fimbrial subunit n=1 Tax=Escherichia coli TaxID=562 RepID=UPI0010CCAC00|nr:fimbrial protein [Escherichia coli]GCP70748.1 K88 fimbrial protein AC [Escherichia coli]